MRVSLAQRKEEGASPALPLLDPKGARVILGAQASAPLAPIVPSAHSLFGPRGACLTSSAGPLFVCDTGHHRLLVWNHVPAADDTPADLVIGQPDFSTEGRNAKGAVGSATLNVPTGVAYDGGVLAVADAWNHRVLLWRKAPRRSNQPADVVLGQPNFECGLANCGLGHARADTLYWPYGVAIHRNRLYVADTGNRRVLLWDSVPQRNGTAADVILEAEMRWPHGLTVCADRLYVADAGLSRVLEWKGRRFSSSRAEELNMPYAVAVQADRLVVADTANSRLIGLPLGGGPARWLAGQRNWNEKGDNRWSFAARDNLCWPYGVYACGETLIIADSGNNRVLLWDRA